MILDPQRHLTVLERLPHIFLSLHPGHIESRWMRHTRSRMWGDHWKYVYCHWVMWVNNNIIVKSGILCCSLLLRLSWVITRFLWLFSFRNFKLMLTWLFQRVHRARRGKLLRLTHGCSAVCINISRFLCFLEV